MSAFNNHPDDWQRLDWQILQNSPVALYYSQDILRTDVQWFESEHYEVHWFDAADWVSKADFHQAAARELRFPTHYGCNLDAFDDSLSDLEVPAEGGTALVLQRFDVFASRHANMAQNILDIIASNSRIFALFGQRLIALVHVDNRTTKFEPVGACHVLMSPSEPPPWA